MNVTINIKRIYQVNYIPIHYWAKKNAPLFVLYCTYTYNTYSYATINLTVTIGTSARAIGVGKYNTRVYVEALRADTDRYVYIGTSWYKSGIYLYACCTRTDEKIPRVHVIRGSPPVVLVVDFSLWSFKTLMIYKHIPAISGFDLRCHFLRSRTRHDRTQQRVRTHNIIL